MQNILARIKMNKGLIPLVAAATIAVGGALYESNEVQARPISTTIPTQISSGRKDLSRAQMRAIIAKEYFKKRVGMLTKRQWHGVNNAAARATVTFDPDCDTHLLNWDTKYVRWGMDSWVRRRRRKRSRSTRRTSRRSKPSPRPSVTNNYNTTVNIDARKYETNVTTHVHPTVGKARLDEHGRRLTKIETNLKDWKSIPYDERSRVAATFGLFNERMGGKGFSRGYFGGVEGMLRGKWGSKVGRLELDLKGFGTEYQQGTGWFRAFMGRFAALFGKRYRSKGLETQVLGGVEADVLAGTDGYGGIDAHVTEGAAKGVLKVRADSEYVSAEGSVAVGGGAQRVQAEGVDITSPLLRVDGKLQLEGHLGKHVDILARMGLRYDRLTVDGVPRDNTTLYGGGGLRAILGHGVFFQGDVEGGKHWSNLGDSTYVQGNLLVGKIF